ncbi:acyl carrier protein [Paraliobacillus sp. JSM ZJ581]|uniref:acyl carrier protein n=1 Tax=Paraliobacillus sp. JSM ZJ581 TaxID=3342118 RepID=UPI0035A84159
MTKLINITKEIVADVLEVEENEFDENTSLISDLDAESLDLLDILFKLSKQTGIKVSMQDIQNDVRGGLTEEEFLDEDGYITETGVENIRKAFNDETIALSNATSKDVLKLVTISYILKFYEREAVK